MKIAICMPAHRQIWFQNIFRLFAASFQDLGHTASDLDNAELVFCIQQWPHAMTKDAGRKYVLLQTEQPGHELPQSIEADQTWGFMVDRPSEKYIYMGYHPCLEVVSVNPTHAHVISFCGTLTARRANFWATKRYRPDIVNGFEIAARVRNAKATSINLNLHAFGPTAYTEWDRISLYLANRCFFMSESLYCPVPVMQFTEPYYDDLIIQYESWPKACQEYADDSYKYYRKYFDHRNQLAELLGAL